MNLYLFIMSMRRFLIVVTSVIKCFSNIFIECSKKRNESLKAVKQTKKDRMIMIKTKNGNFVVVTKVFLKDVTAYGLL